MANLPTSSRRIYFIPFQGTKANPATIVATGKYDRSEMDELIRAQCEKRGVDAEQAIEQAETVYEEKARTAEASKELHMRIREQTEYSRLRWGGLKPPQKRSQGGKP